MITLDNVKEMIPQVLFILVLGFNLLAALIDRERNFVASLIATIILISLTYWGGFYGQLIDIVRI